MHGSGYLCGSDDNISSTWSHEKTVKTGQGLVGLTVLTVPALKISVWASIRVGIDDLSFSCADGIPSLSSNLVINASFEDDGSAVVSPKEWHFAGTNPESTYLEKNSNTASGRFHVFHYSSQAHDAYTWQSLYGLENGTYTLKAMVQSGGGQTQKYWLRISEGLK